MKRIEIHLTDEETTILDQIAVEDGRSRKNLCETEIRKLIKERGQKKKLLPKMLIRSDDVAFADNVLRLCDGRQSRT